MVEASLTFPAICLALSFLFIISVYHASIKEHLGAFHQNIIIPVYQKIEANLASHIPPDHIPTLEARYEAMDIEPKNEEEEQDLPSVRHTPSPSPSPSSSPYHQRGDKTPTPTRDIYSPVPESRNASESARPSRGILYAGGPHRPMRAEDYAGTAELSGRSTPDAVFDDEYDTDWSNSAADEMVYEPQKPIGDIPVWEFEMEREIYGLNERGQQGPEVWLDEVVEWTAESVFAVVAPEMLPPRF
ncbi:hypothetical protein N7475_007899 [Penicillium sp. IBT 31633x]|nr:hypothetical protein N7475_007899 [Penicillium sp. IBT 31633x]